MAYENTTSRRTIAEIIRATFVFEGRSTRTELCVYYIFARLIAAVTAGLLAMALDFDSSRRATLLLLGLLEVPMLGLIVRRFHDLGLSGKWAMAAMVLQVPTFLLDQVRWRSGGFTVTYASPEWIGIPAFAVGMCLLLICLRKGDDGANRFGPNPRHSDIASMPPAVI